MKKPRVAGNDASSMSPKEEMGGAAGEGLGAGKEGGGAGLAAGILEGEVSTMDVDVDAGMGMFSVLPAEAVGEILTHLALTDLGAISKTVQPQSKPFSPCMGTYFS